MANILLVEDDENLAYMLCENLEIEGFEVKHINKGAKALAEHEVNLDD